MLFDNSRNLDEVAALKTAKLIPNPPVMMKHTAEVKNINQLMTKVFVEHPLSKLVGPLVFL